MIEKHLDLKPNKLLNEDINTDHVMSNSNDQAVCPSLKSSAEHIVVLEDELVKLQTNFNRQLRDVAREKILIRYTIDAHNKRLREIHDILKEEGEATIINEQVTFHLGEYDSCNFESERRDTIQDANRFYVKCTIHDSDFLLHGDIDLSSSAAGLKSRANASLQSESKQLIISAQSAIDKFENSLSHMKQIRFEVALRLKLKLLLFEALSKQVEVLLAYDAKDDDPVMGINMSKKKDDLKSIQCVVPVLLSDVEVCKKTNWLPMLTSKKMLDDTNLEIAGLEINLEDAKSQALCLRRDRKRLNNKIATMRNELLNHQGRCEEIQIQKFGKRVDPSVLDVSPVKANQTKEVDQLQNELELFHQRNIDHAKKNQASLKGQLLSVTNVNTKLLHETASLREQQMKTDQEIKRASSSKTRSNAIKTSENHEYEKFLALSFEQKEQIELIKQEIEVLKSKCGHVSYHNNVGLL